MFKKISFVLIGVVFFYIFNIEKVFAHSNYFLRAKLDYNMVVLMLLLVVKMLIYRQNLSLSIVKCSLLAIVNVIEFIYLFDFSIIIVEKFSFYLTYYFACKCNQAYEENIIVTIPLTLFLWFFTTLMINFITFLFDFIFMKYIFKIEKINLLKIIIICNVITLIISLLYIFYNNYINIADFYINNYQLIKISFNRYYNDYCFIIQTLIMLPVIIIGAITIKKIRSNINKNEI